MVWEEQLPLHELGILQDLFWPLRLKMFPAGVQHLETDTTVKRAFVISWLRLDQPWQPREIIVRTTVTHSMFFSFLHKFFPGLCCFANEWTWNTLFFIFYSLPNLSCRVIKWNQTLCVVVHRSLSAIFQDWLHFDLTRKNANIKMMLLKHDTSIKS